MIRVDQVIVGIGKECRPFASGSPLAGGIILDTMDLLTFGPVGICGGFLIAMAERAWHHADWSVPYNAAGAIYNKDTSVFTGEHKAKRDAKWQTFGNAIAQKELIKLDTLGVFYRVPTVGAMLIDNKLHINSSLPGLPLEYQ